MSSDSQIEAYAAQRLDELVELARDCPAGGDERWDAALNQLGVDPLPADERARHLAEGPKLSKGALPLELRWALEKTVEPMQAHIENTGRLSAMVEQRLRDYVTAVKPTVSTSSIFANALATSGATTTTKAGAEALTCPCCGAPRMGSDATECAFCGTDMLKGPA